MKYFIPILFLGFLFANCNNDLEIPTVDPVVQLAEDVKNIDDYLATNNLTADTTASGLRYVVEDKGRGGAIDATATIDVLLNGYFLDGSSFDQTDDCSPVTLFLPDLIPGFSEGVQQFNIWGKGKLFLPSELAFGQSGSSNGSIPANTVIAFDIEVVEQKEFDNTKIKTYIADNSLTNIDSTLSGIFYTISEVGSGENPSPNATVTVSYKGYLADGTVFDQSEAPVTFGLNGVIQGWREALPLLKKDGSGTFLIPSNLAYGSSGSGNSIASNTMLIFDITLVDFSE